MDATEDVKPAAPGFRTLVLRALAIPLDVLDGLGQTILLAFRVLLWLVRRPFRARQFLASMDFIGVESLFIVSLTGVFVGMVFALQTVYGFRRFSAEGMVGGVVALSLTREISPVFAALMVTSRAGSAMAAELGNMRVTEQIDAIATMGVSPIQYLVVPRVVASVLVLPCLCILFTIIGMAGAYGVGVGMLGVDPGIFMDRVRQFVQPRDLWMGMVKSAVFGFIISIISCKQGFFASGGAKGVGIATTRAVVQSAVSILVANYVITSIMTDV
ncbi:MAG: ABC transporter permease [Deltaproteobacteria bacterium]|nr:ABC transporter permease [Deltaproteobacteria bacterium]